MSDIITPILTLSLGEMRHRITMAFSERMDELKAMVASSVEKVATPEAIQAAIDNHLQVHMHEAIRSAIVAAMEEPGCQARFQEAARRVMAKLTDEDLDRFIGRLRWGP